MFFTFHRFTFRDLLNKAIIAASDKRNRPRKRSRTCQKGLLVFKTSPFHVRMILPKSTWSLKKYEKMQFNTCCFRSRDIASWYKWCVDSLHGLTADLKISDQGRSFRKAAALSRLAFKSVTTVKIKRTLLKEVYHGRVRQQTQVK